jgi:hypothetical protein
LDQLLDNWETTARAIAEGLDLVWPNLQEAAVSDMENILKPQYRHHRIADDRTPVPLDDLTMRAWQAAGRALNGDETTAQASFDEIRAAVSRLDRFSAPSKKPLKGSSVE